MKSLYYLILLAFVVSCTSQTDSTKNPFLTELNVPVDYANVSANDIEEYASITLENVLTEVNKIKQNEAPTFDNVFATIDDIYYKIDVAGNNCFMLYWVSPDSLSRVKGLAGYQLLDSLATTIYSDKAIFDMILQFKQSGVNLEDDKLSKYKKLTKEINQLTSEYSVNMNTANEVLLLDEQGAEGFSENFKNTYKVGENQYEIPIINATRRPVMNNAKNEETRKAYYFKYYNRASDKNLEILDNLVQKRYELANIMGYESYAAYYLSSKMAKNPETVWNFINDLVNRATEKAKSDIKVIKNIKNEDLGTQDNSPLRSWDVAYYNNQILKTNYQVDHEKIREYLVMENCLEGVFNIYENLLGLEIRKVENPSVWHEEVELYEVFEGEDLKGRFYLDLFPRPNKESWFYGVGLNSGKATEQGYEVPVKMLLGNFTRPTETLPSLLSFNELSTLFHEFGHIFDGLSYNGEFAAQASSKSDFGESMSQIFENWIWDYEMLSSFAKHYETGEVLPKEMFDNMLNAKNVSSGYYTLSSLRSCIYDLNLYDKYNPKTPISTDELWRKIDKKLDVMKIYEEGTHPQASWIHINTHPVYYYGYLWADVYAQDMFTEFEKNGLQDLETGLRFRDLILANGTQRDIVEAVEEFLGRPSNNEAYIKSLGLN
jgi:thimet oligopeptidase